MPVRPRYDRLKLGFHGQDGGAELDGGQLGRLMWFTGPPPSTVPHPTASMGVTNGATLAAASTHDTQTHHLPPCLPGAVWGGSRSLRQLSSANRRSSRRQSSLTRPPMASVDLNSAGLTAFPDLPPDVETLELYANKIKKVPPSIGALTRLQVLNAFNNQIGLTLPNEIGTLSSLVEVNLAANRLAVLKDAHFAAWGNVEVRA